MQSIAPDGSTTLMVRRAGASCGLTSMYEILPPVVSTARGLTSPIGSPRLAGASAASVAVMRFLSTRSRIRLGASPGKRRYGNEARELDALDHQLGDAITHGELDALASIGVEQRHPDLAAVARVDSAGGVDDGDPVLGREARTRVNEADVACGQRDAHSRAHRGPLPWRDA